MPRLYSGLAIFAVLLLPAGSPSATAGTTVYVSTFDGNQVLSIDGETGAVAVIPNTLDGDPSFDPEDIVFGPDKKIYICNSSHNQIWRLDPVTGAVEAVYDAATSTLANPPLGPEGPSLHGSGDLFFNTRDPSHSGVWMIPGIASLSGGPFPNPVNVLTAGQTGSTFGEGTTFGLAGKLLVVDRSGNRVLVSLPSSIPPYNSVSPLITSSLNTPIGIAVNSTGDIFVASSGASQANVNRFNAGGVLQGTYATFMDPNDTVSINKPAFMEFDGAGRLFVVTGTGSDGSGGKVWRVVPPGGGANTTLLVRLADQLCGECEESECTTGLLTDKARGVAVVPTSFSINKHYSSSITSNTYGFGFATLQLSFPGTILGDFDLTFTRVPTAPADLAAQLQANFPAGTTCIHESAAGAFCTTYVATKGLSGVPHQGVDFTGQYLFQLSTFSQDLISTPAIGHAQDNSIQFPIDQFDRDILTNFSPIIQPGGDPAGQAQTDGFSTFAGLNLPLVQNGKSCGFLPPLVPKSIFLAGQGIPVKFQLTTGPNCTGSFITDAVARLSITKVSNTGNTFAPVQSEGNTNFQNFFRVAGNQYIYNLNTKPLGPGTYFLIVFSNKAAPQSIQIQLR